MTKKKEIETKVEETPMVTSEASANKNSVYVPNRVLLSIQKIIDYAHHEECLNYLEDPKEDHIFLSVKTVENWLDTSKDIIRCQKEHPEIPSIKCGLPKGHLGWCASDQDREVMWG